MRKLTWLFDLDNTLHNASHAIFPAINVNMNAFIAQVMGEGGVPASEAAVNAARVAYWQRYGATLLGMVKHHQVRQEDFLREAHRFDDLPTMIRAERGLGRLLKRLPGRKILLTNAPRRYSHDVMRHLGLHRHFARHIPIESMRVHGQLRPKPSKQMLRKLIAKERTSAGRCILVEDTVGHLKAAKALGMSTAWVTQYLGSQAGPAQAITGPSLSKMIKRPAYVDVKVKSVRQLLGSLHRLR
jgi:putative hydrolase of the HAD superfamily